jgi:hypothetical protein
MTAALEDGEWSAARPDRNLSPGKDPVPLYRRLGGSQGRSGRRKHLVLTGIRFRTVQTVDQSLYRLSYPVDDRNEYQEYFLGSKGDRWKKVDNVTAFMC